MSQLRNASHLKLALNTRGLTFSRRARYRVRQFWHTLRAKPDPEQLARARTFLSTAEFDLFLRMQPSEQAHSLKVLERLVEQGQTHSHLLAAALLHDAGKSVLPLAAWQRALIVMGKALFPARALAWGRGTGGTGGIKKTFVVAAQHAQWGAALAEQAGSSPVTVELVRRHQDHLPVNSENLTDQLLALLQAADEEF